MKIYSFEEACQRLGLDPDNCLPDVSRMPVRHQPGAIADAKICYIAEASRAKDPNWNDRDEQKWGPWFDMEMDKNNPTGFRFFASGYGLVITAVTGGSLHCYESKEDSDFHAVQHIELYRHMMVLPPKE